MCRCFASTSDMAKLWSKAWLQRRIGCVSLLAHLWRAHTSDFCRGTRKATAALVCRFWRWQQRKHQDRKEVRPTRHAFRHEGETHMTRENHDTTTKAIEEWLRTNWTRTVTKEEVNTWTNKEKTHQTRKHINQTRKEIRDIQKIHIGDKRATRNQKQNQSDETSNGRTTKHL